MKKKLVTVLLASSMVATMLAGCGSGSGDGTEKGSSAKGGDGSVYMLNFKPETADTLEGNAMLKAEYIYKNYGLDCFADDTGLEVEALNGAPGVYSARYAGGEGHNAEANMQKLLQNMQGVQNRKAQFRTAICLILDGKKHLFEGIVKGEIIKEKRGSSGFGYDPIFVPEGYTKTFAELGNETKNKISHRALAVEKLCRFLKA